MRKMVILLALAHAAFAAAGDWTPLFNGRDLSGWEMVGPGRFVVENGMLKTEGGMGLLWFKGQRLGDRTLRVVFRTATPKANSGVYIRMPEPPPDPWYGVHNGYEVQIDAGGDEWHSTGAIYSLSKVTKQAKLGEWNTLEIQLDGPVTRISLNGEMVNEFKEGQAVPERKMWFEPVRGPRPNYGYIGLQNHDANSTVYFREVSVSGPLAPRIDRGYALSYYQATRKQVLDTIAGMTPEQLEWKPSPDRWSAREVLEHIILSESGMYDWIQASLTKPDGKGPASITDEQFQAAMKNRQEKHKAPAALVPAGLYRTPGELAREFRERRDRNIAWLSGVSDDLRGRTINWPGGTISVWQLTLAIPSHTERHLAQIGELKADPGFPKGR